MRPGARARLRGAVAVLVRRRAEGEPDRVHPLDPGRAGSEADCGAVLPLHGGDQERGQCEADGGESAAVCDDGADGAGLSRWIEGSDGGRDIRVRSEAGALGFRRTRGVTGGRGGEDCQSSGRGGRTVAHNGVLWEEPRCRGGAGQVGRGDQRLEGSRHGGLGHVLSFGSQGQRGAEVRSR